MLARMTLDDVWSQFRTDMFLNSLTESAITIPTGMSSDRLLTSSAAAQEVLGQLTSVVNLLRTDLPLIVRRGTVTHIRETSISLALMETLRSSLGTEDNLIADAISRLVDASTGVTLRREMLEAIKHKFLDPVAYNDLQWPSLGVDAPAGNVKRAHQRLNSDPFDNSDDEVDLTASPWLRDYWNSVKSRYQSEGLALSDASASQCDILPAHWTVLNISVTDDKNTLLVTRRRAHRKPLVFCLPLKGRRENEADEHLAFSDVMNELKDILRLNDEGTRQAASVTKGDKAARAAWWANRTALDKKLQELLQNIEFCWFGAFKTILSAPIDIPSQVLDRLRSRLEQIFAASHVSREKKQMIQAKLDDSILECFAALPIGSRDEELEDLIYHILDLYQFHGASVSIAEVDIDQLVVDLRGVLEEHAAKTARFTKPVQDSHTFLVLDKNVQGIPWESLPMLRGQTVLRVPNLDFLMDRVDYAHQHNAFNRVLPQPNDAAVDRIAVNARKAYCFLNPSGDLKNTEQRFSAWLGSMKSVGWDGLVGRTPSEQQFADALTRNDLVIYFGHGGAEQYIRSSKIRHLQRCAATMLWGCSSGTLREMGDFDRIGTPHNYMLAGCPTLVANLWDVTDRDIDKYSQVVFDQLHLTPEGVAQPRPKGKAVSVAKAVADARSCCKLKYLTGAAPVIYGIPFYL